MKEPIVDPCLVDLTRTDVYPGGVVPDADFETCLKVLRTVAKVCGKKQRIGERDALHSAHGVLHDLCEEVQRNERAERATDQAG